MSAVYSLVAAAALLALPAAKAVEMCEHAAPPSLLEVADEPETICLAPELRRTEAPKPELAKADPQLAEKQVLTEYIVDKFNKPKALASRIVDTVYKEAAALNVAPLLALAIIERESSFKPDAANPSGATGLMQVMRKYHTDKLAQLGHGASLYHPETNIKVGIQVLREYVSLAAGNVQRALTQYSGGSTDYAKAVLQKQRSLERLATAPASLPKAMTSPSATSSETPHASYLDWFRPPR